HLGYDKWEYAEALYILGNKKRNGELVVLALAGSNKKVLLERVRRILNLQGPQADFLKPALLFFLCIIGVMAAESYQSQPHDITAVNTFSVSTAEQTDGQVQHLPGPIPVTTSTPPMLSGERMLAGNGQNIPRAVDENKTPISPNAPPNSSSPESYYDSIELPVQ